MNMYFFYLERKPTFKSPSSHINKKAWLNETQMGLIDKKKT